MLEARGVIGHDIRFAWEIAREVAVPMKTLVVAGYVTQVGSRSVGGYCPFVEA